MKRVGVLIVVKERRDPESTPTWRGISHDKVGRQDELELQEFLSVDLSFNDSDGLKSSGLVLNNAPIASP